ncbi:hypothetical protein U9M48_037582 [Paspalum notatum var. saurae]|uniref:AAA+ ATPase domain-containing protein n=1 Tax=Paspalum notatum var. saurae TaxID=547442 RepID=A0AAQ3XAS9_PASNO
MMLQLGEVHSLHIFFEARKMEPRTGMLVDNVEDTEIQEDIKFERVSICLGWRYSAVCRMDWQFVAVSSCKGWFSASAVISRGSKDCTTASSTKKRRLHPPWLELQCTFTTSHRPRTYIHALELSVQLLPEARLHRASAYCSIVFIIEHTAHLFKREMEIAISAARWAVGAALGPVSDGLLESWAASSELGPNVRALKLELLYAQGMLNNARGRDVHNPALGQLLLELRHHAYDADDVLDELEYFRVQDELEGTYETTDTDERGLVGGFLLNVHHTARAVVRKLKLPSCSSASVCHCKHHRKPKLKFDRVALSKRMVEIVELLKPVCAKVSTILDLELLSTIASNSATGTIKGTASSSQTRITTPQIIETKLFGRDKLKTDVMHDITSKYRTKDLTVLSIVGPGGLGKTTFTQHIYQEVKSHFQVLVWICVSQNFSANRLAQEIVKQIPKVGNEKENESAEELIEKRLQSKQFFLVLDDMWADHEDEWKKLLAPLKKGQTKGNIVIVTTRIPKVAQMVTTIDSPIRLERLNDEQCMSFLKACVFDEEQSWEGHTNLRNIGLQIVKRLKGFPLAVKTVGRLLKTELTLDHWTRIFESKEWEYRAGDDDIMPALKLSYNYLPFHLQQCFSHCALFPEDYKFGREELIHLWIGLGLLGSVGDQNKRIEDVGLGYLRDLVSHGFFHQEDKKEDCQTYYAIHDLLHDLAKNVSSNECISIQGANVWSVQVPASIRHMSIAIENADVQDKTTFENRKMGLNALGKKLKAANLCTLLLFGDHHGSFCKLFGDMFREAKSLRLIFLSGTSYDVEDLLPSFSQFVHLRYLRIKGYVLDGKSLVGSISRFYNLLVLDLKECYNDFGSTREMSNLLKIRHFLVRDDSYHSRIFEVGKLKSIQELRRFEVKKERNGFELDQLGQLLQLHGSLEIHNLEKIEATTELEEIKLFQLHHLNRLVLKWDKNQPNRDPEKEQGILERLKPHKLPLPHMFPNLEQIDISNCEELASVPQIPSTSAMCKATLWRAGASIKDIRYNKNLQHVSVQFRKDALDSELVNILAFSNLSEINSLRILECPAVPLDQLLLLKSLKILEIGGCRNVLWPTEAKNNAQFKSVVEQLNISNWGGTAKELAQVISYFPNLSKLELRKCESKEAGEIEYEAGASSGGQPLLPLQIKELLENQSSLRSLLIRDCPMLLSSSSLSSFSCPFPTSLQSLELSGVKDGTLPTLAPLTNLIRLELYDCGGVKSEDLWHLLGQGHLKELQIWGTHNLFDVSSEPSRICGQDVCHSSRPQVLETEEEAGTVAASSIGGHFSSCLTKLVLIENDSMEHFTQAQSEALQMLTSLEDLQIDRYSRLQSLPERLSGLLNLKTLWIEFCDSIRSLPKGGLPGSLVELYIWGCDAIRSLPKATLPSSLTKLDVHGCDAFRSLPKESLPSSLTELSITHCPAIRSLPNKGRNLPSSLQILDVRGSNEKLKRQCRKLVGTIPIVTLDWA